MQKFELKDICFFDCETTGVPAKGLKWDADFEQFPHVVQLAWSLGDKEKSYIIKPDNYEIPPETTAIHGITTERAIAEGVPFAEVVDEFLADANAAPLVCAHNIYFDSSMLKANVLRYCGREYLGETVGYLNGCLQIRRPTFYKPQPQCLFMYVGI
jgi:DNA polymerase III epsilon subunit-like protein